MKQSDAFLARFEALHPKLIDLDLKRVLRLLNRLGAPHLKLPPVVHVAGTNGKGSVVAMLRAMAEAAGRSVHVYTSPHLVRFNERIRLAGRLIDEDHLVEVFGRCERANGGEAITIFEMTTAAALLAFAETPADLVLLETGMGGRYDATNVVPKPALTVITPVDLDHQTFLGETIAAIAGEKAGILKPDVPAIIGSQTDEGLARIEAEAARIGAPLTVHGRDFLAFEERGLLIVQTEAGLTEFPRPALPGAHQILNGGIAVTAARALGGLKIGDSAIARGLAATLWPARLQRLDAGRLFGHAGLELWLDGGHNPHAARALAQHFAALAARGPKPLTLIVGMLSTKDAGAFLAALAPLSPRVLTVAIPAQAAAASAEALAAAAQSAGLTAQAMPSLEAALAEAAAEVPSPRTLVCGSLYLAGHVLAGDPPQ